MSLSDEQIASVKQIYLMLGDNDEFDLETAIEALQSAEQLHLFVHNWNWDSGGEPLFSVIRHPICDKGTALRVFWLTDPIHFFQNYIKREEVKGWEQEFYDLVAEIRDKFKAGFYKSENIYCDPKEESGGRFKFDILKQEIPEEMRCPTKGQNINDFMVDFGLS